MKNHSNRRCPAGFISAGCLPYMVVLVLLIMGAQGVYTAVKNRTPLEISVRDFITRKPDAEWITLTKAHLNLLEAAQLQRLGKTEEVFIPVRPEPEPVETPVHLLLSTKDRQIIDALEDMEGEATRTQSEAAQAVSRHADKLFVTRDVSGLVRFGMNSDDKVRRKLTTLRMNLAPDYVILNEGEKPELLQGLLMLAGGVLMGLYLLRHASAKATPQGSPPAPPPALPPRP